MVTRKIEQDDILDLVNCADDYGHWNRVCMSSLYAWASPVSDEDIESYATSLTDEDGYTSDDRESSITTLTEWRNQYSGETK